MATNIEQKPTQNGFRLPRVPLAVLGCCIALTTLSYAAVTSQSTDERPLRCLQGAPSLEITVSTKASASRTWWRKRRNMLASLQPCSTRCTDPGHRNAVSPGPLVS